MPLYVMPKRLRGNGISVQVNTGHCFLPDSKLMCCAACQRLDHGRVYSFCMIAVRTFRSKCYFSASYRGNYGLYSHELRSNAYLSVPRPGHTYIWRTPRSFSNLRCHCVLSRWSCREGKCDPVSGNEIREASKTGI